MTKTEAVEKTMNRIVLEVVLSEDQGNFKFGGTDLPDTAKAKIDQVVSQLMSDPKGAYFESPAGKNYRHAVYYTKSEGVKHL